MKTEALCAHDLSYDKECYCFPFRGLSGWMALLPHFSQSLPESLATITRLSLTQLGVRPVERPLSASCFWGICHVSTPPKLTVKQCPSLFASPLFINGRLGAGAWARGGGEDSETSAASPHSRLCQLEISLEWSKESNAVFCERQRPAGYRRLFSLPWPLKSSVDLQVLFHLLKSLLQLQLSTYHSFTCFSLLPR